MPAVASSLSARVRRNEALSEIRTGEILTAATRVFGRKGYEATRAEDIAAAAGIAKGTLYLYFDSKEAIYSATVSRACRELRAELERHTAQVTGFQEKLRTALQVRLEYWTENQSIYRLLLTVGREQKHRRQTADFLRAAQRDYKTLLQDGVDAGEFACDDLEQLAWATLDLVRGASERRIDKLGESDPRQDALRITAFVLAQNTRRPSSRKR
ncbi:TetR/AcrR family transcriptional regulator [Terriglobus aquaticus]|uniref:TetR/AcrR family transcriptional regulator n=1 Tax=Terriglobus aquaticus TaxID=940139 RepID=A0ABW9KNL2_9BACT|nr:TetR/AcrR family transcriptional regulator [Terriglobus aquaticus]